MREFLIAYGISQKLLKLQDGNPLKTAIASLFKLDEKSFLLQEFNRDWNDWIDVDNELTVLSRTKLRIQLIPSCSCIAPSSTCASCQNITSKICHCRTPHFVSNESFDKCNQIISHNLITRSNNLNNTSNHSPYQNTLNKNISTALILSSSTNNVAAQEEYNLSNIECHAISNTHQQESSQSLSNENNVQLIPLGTISHHKSTKSSLQHDRPFNSVFFQEHNNSSSKLNISKNLPPNKSDGLLYCNITADSEVSWSSYESDIQDSSAEETGNFDPPNQTEPAAKVLLWNNEVLLPEERFTTYLKMQLDAGQPLSKKAKHDLLDALAEYLCQFTAYPTRSMREQVAQALVTKYPHLKEDIGNGITGWATKLCNKLKKMRFEMNRNKIDILLAKRYWYDRNPTERKKLKKSHSNQINWAPDFPFGEDESSLKVLQNWLLDEYKKYPVDRDVDKINETMNKTFILRRRMVNVISELSEIKKVHPFLFEEHQLFNEFQRLMQFDLQKNFTEKIYVLAPKILAIVGRKKKKHPQQICFLQILTDILQREHWSAENVKHLKAIVGLKMLPYCFQENPNCFYREVEVGNVEFPERPCPYILCHEGKPLNYSTEISIMYNGNMLIPHIQDFIQAMALLFATYYCCNIQFPPEAQLTFLFIQHSICGIPCDNKIPARLISFIEKFKELKD